MSSDAQDPAARKRVVFSVDVDDFPGSEPGVEWLLDSLASQKVVATFFLTGGFAKRDPALSKEIASKGHEIGCHGLAHGLDWDENFGTMSREVQLERLRTATELIRESTGVTPVGFRAPYLSVGPDTMGILQACGYAWDSSVGSRRFDFGFGRVNKPAALLAPTHPYHPRDAKPWRRGSSNLLEVPCSAFFVPYSLTSARVFGGGLFRILDGAVRRSHDPTVFLMHPWELVEAAEVDHGRKMPKRHVRGRGLAAQEWVSAFLDRWAGRCDWIPCGSVAGATPAGA